MVFTTLPNQQIIGMPKLAVQSVPPVDMNRVASIVLGGGQGKRLEPLTNERCKPAVCFGGKYRLIDIPISNAINSGCFNIFVITQFLSASLHQHLFKTYRMGNCSPGFIEILSAEQRPSQESWFQGSADAVRQNINYLLECPVDYFLILSGDQLYNIDFHKMVKFAKETDVDMVIASLPVAESEARRMGLLKLNEDRMITEFHEKPQERELLDRMRMPEYTIRQLGQSVIDQKRHYLGSMGIYLFKRKALFDLLEKDLREDFGKHLIPTQVASGSVAAYLYDGYWEDIGTLESFYNANIALTKSKPVFDCYDERNPIFSQHPNLAPPRITNTRIENSLICDGSLIEADEIKNSILGMRSVVKSGCIIRNSYLMGNDFYHPPMHTDRVPDKLEIGENCIIEKAILDKDVCLGKGVKLINKNKLKNYDSDNVYIRDGIIVVTRGAHLPDGYVL